VESRLANLGREHPAVMLTAAAAAAAAAGNEEGAANARGNANAPGIETLNRQAQ